MAKGYKAKTLICALMLCFVFVFSLYSSESATETTDSPLTTETASVPCHHENDSPSYHEQTVKVHDPSCCEFSYASHSCCSPLAYSLLLSFISSVPDARTQTRTESYRSLDLDVVPRPPCLS